MLTILHPHHENFDRSRSATACDACRRRKVKCNKGLPRCANCQACRQACNYPTRTLKPGPKLGSVHKRRLFQHQDGLRHVANIRTAPKSAPRERCRVEPTRQSEFGGADEEALRCSRHMQTVSELCLPSNEKSASNDLTTVANSTDSDLQPGHVLMSACNTLNLTPEQMKQSVDKFFRTFTPFGLFREPSFFTKLAAIQSEVQLNALLAAIFAFSTNGTESSDRQSASHFADLAITSVDDAFVEIADEIPPLCLLQALILLTHWLILKGVRGRAWRYLGLCIRVAFELGLHSTDDGKDLDRYIEDVEAWCADEERRRAYWAIREMDQHANHLKHVPFLTDWTQNQVFLPAEDQKWFQGIPHRSCVAASDHPSRVQTLQAIGNRSARAWYIVLFSLLAEVWDLTYPTTKIHGSGTWKSTVSDPEFSNHRTRLLNAVQLYLKMLPSELKFCGQPLDFGTRACGRNKERWVIHDHSWIALIALMTEIVNLVLHKPFVFEAYLQKAVKAAREGASGHGKRSSLHIGEKLDEKVELCYAGSDAILNIFLLCHETHYQYIHPYISQSAWSSATVQLLRGQMTENTFEKQIIRSKFDILKSISDRFVYYWEMSRVPEQNLDELDLRLRQFTIPSRNVKYSSKSPKIASQSQTTANDTGVEQNTNFGFVANLDGSGTLDLPSHHPSHLPLTTTADCGDLRTQISGVEVPHGLGFDSPSTFYPPQSQSSEDSGCVPFEEPESTETMWLAGDIAHPLNVDGTSEPLDWLSYFTNADLNGELLHCYEAFSGSFLN